jgi:hypothetical protein
MLLNGVRHDSFTKDDEEGLEKKGVMFMLSTGVPGRFCAELDAIVRHDANMRGLRGTRWGFLYNPGPLGLLSPDCPAKRWIPVNRRVALLAGSPDRHLDDEAVTYLNKTVFQEARSLVFGHPDDFCEFLRYTPRPWG